MESELRRVLPADASTADLRLRLLLLAPTLLRLSVTRASDERRVAIRVFPRAIDDLRRETSLKLLLSPGSLVRLLMLPEASVERLRPKLRLLLLLYVV